MKFQAQSFANCKLGISWIFLNIQAANTGKLLPENPTNHADSRTFKNIQGVLKTFVYSWNFLNVHEFQVHIKVQENSS